MGRLESRPTSVLHKTTAKIELERSPEREVRSEDLSTYSIQNIRLDRQTAEQEPPRPAAGGS